MSPIKETVTQETLIIIEPGGGIQDVATHSNIVQQIGSRVFIVEGLQTEKLRNAPGVQTVATGPIASDLYSDLSEAEQLFVAAWSDRQTKPKTTRPGDGLDWDTPGFEEP